MDFITDLLISVDWKDDTCSSILVVVGQLTKTVHYEPVKVIINALSQAEIIINVVVRHHQVLESIVMDQALLFTLKFWSLLYYFLVIKRKLSITFHLQIYG